MNHHAHRIILVLVSAVILILSGKEASAQQENESRTMFDLRTNNNELYRGYVLERRADTLHFQTLSGVVLKLHVPRIQELTPTESGVRDDGRGAAAS